VDRDGGCTDRPRRSPRPPVPAGSRFVARSEPHQPVHGQWQDRQNAVHRNHEASVRVAFSRWPNGSGLPAVPQDRLGAGRRLRRRASPSPGSTRRRRRCRGERVMMSSGDLEPAGMEQVSGGVPPRCSARPACAIRAHTHLANRWSVLRSQRATARSVRRGWRSGSARAGHACRVFAAYSHGAVRRF
jgi:hypothetical protein